MTEYEKMLWWLDTGQLIGPPDRKAISDFIRAQSAEVSLKEGVIAHLNEELSACKLAYGKQWKEINRLLTEVDTLSGSQDRMKPYLQPRCGDCGTLIENCLDICPECGSGVKASVDSIQKCSHVWLHDIRPLTTKENRCTLCGTPAEKGQVQP